MHMQNRESVLAEKADICTQVFADDPNGAPIPPIYQNSLFVQASNNTKYFYTRDTNPTIEYTESVIARLEHAEKALCFSSGMGAISASIIACLAAGDHVVAMKSIYGPTGSVFEDLLARYGVSTTRIGKYGAEDFEAAITPRTRLFYIESPTYGLYEVIDIRAVTALAKRHGILTLMDNTWSSPIFQNPLDYGVDIVLHSASKYLGGHSDIVAGVACGSRELMDKVHRETRMSLGSNMDPHQAWLLLRGLRTLPFRMQAHESSALKVAAFLQSHPKVAKVNFPGRPDYEKRALVESQMCGFSGLLSFLYYGDCAAFIARLKRIHTGPSWGGFESLATSLGNPLSLPPEQGKEPSVIRLSVGLESAETILDDLRQALEEA